MGSAKRQIEAQYKEPVPTTLERIAACVPVLVEAGCECIGHPVIIWEDGPRVDGHSDPERVIPYFKAWFAETVVPWLYTQHENASIRLPWFCTLKQAFRWVVDIDIFGPSDAVECSNSDPTEAFVQCLEALVEVVKQSKIEGGK